MSGQTSVGRASSCKSSRVLAEGPRVRTALADCGCDHRALSSEKLMERIRIEFPIPCSRRCDDEKILDLRLSTAICYDQRSCMLHAHGCFVSGRGGTPRVYGLSCVDWLR